MYKKYILYLYHKLSYNAINKEVSFLLRKKVYMASHDGLKYILETKKGYVKADGGFTDSEREALVIDYWEFGFVINATWVYQKLGFDDQEVIMSGVSFHTILSPYKERDMIGVSYYLLMGYDYKKACLQSQKDYDDFGLYNDTNCLEYEMVLKQIVLDYYRNNRAVAETLKTPNGNLSLYETDDQDEVVLRGKLKYYYSDIGRVFRYAIFLKNPHVKKYFDMSKEEQDYYNEFQQQGLIEYFQSRFNNEKFSFGLRFNTHLLDIEIVNDELILYLDDWNNGNDFKVAKGINSLIRDFYLAREMHITRMFGSYVILQRINGKLMAVKATPIPIKYCPLMVKLLKEVGGESAEKLLNSLDVSDTKKQRALMCELINEIVIKAGYFDTNRPLNSCEANVLFGASETISSGFKSNILDAAVIVSNNLGTIITTNDSNTQGAVKRMTGLFYTSPSEQIIKTAIDAGIIPVFPYSGEINQIEGVKQAIAMGYKKIAVTLAAQDNELMAGLKKLETDGVTIYKFGLCSTGIDEKTALIMLENADIVWSCASKYVKEYIEPHAIAQVGVKIPVHIMTEKGWQLVQNHLNFMNMDRCLEDITLCTGEEEPVILNQGDRLNLVRKRELHDCKDCPHPCI